MLSLPFDELAHRADECRSAYEKDGVFIVRGAFKGPDLEAMQHHFGMLYETFGPRRELCRNAVHFLEVDDPKYFNGYYNHSSLLAVSRLLMGNDLALYNARTLVKDPNYNKNAWVHQDFPYFMGFENKLNLFICFTDSDAGNGGLWVAPGTHKFGSLATIASLNKQTAKEKFKASCPKLKSGDLLITSLYLWHWSEEAKDDRLRAYLQVIHQPSTDGSGRGILLSGEWKTDLRFANFAPESIFQDFSRMDVNWVYGRNSKEDVA